ncbi:hypothetical protein Q5690_28910, partial [Microcoleus sp. F10-D1]
MIDWKELYNLGLGWFEKATAFFDKALEMKPDPEACNDRGNALDSSGRFDESLASYDK